MRGESMDDALLKSLGQIAGIGGLGLGVVLLVFREIIRKGAGWLSVQRWTGRSQRRTLPGGNFVF